MQTSDGHLEDNNSTTVCFSGVYDMQICYDDDSVIKRIFQLQEPVLFDSMLPYLQEVSAFSLSIDR